MKDKETILKLLNTLNDLLHNGHLDTEYFYEYSTYSVNSFSDNKHTFKIKSFYVDDDPIYFYFKYDVLMLYNNELVSIPIFKDIRSAMIPVENIEEYLKCVTSSLLMEIIDE
jgi:hypothetical protein